MRFPRCKPLPGSVP
jgi:ribosome-associated protein